MSDIPPSLRPVPPDHRARPSQPPSAEQVDKLARQLEDGTYRVDPRRVAEAIVSSVRSTGDKR